MHMWLGILGSGLWPGKLAGYPGAHVEHKQDVLHRFRFTQIIEFWQINDNCFMATGFELAA